jgi:hypothetical protein
MDSFTDYYTLLGVRKDAPPGEIKAAFKKLALQYHPDVYKGNDAHERMRLLLAAYQTLNNPEERKRYDARYTEFADVSISQAGRTRSDEAAYRSSRGAAHNSSRQKASSARRDRERHYDFPSISEGRAVRIELGEMTYALSPVEAQTLLQQGMLRGIASETPTHRYYCHRCFHRWQDRNAAGQLPHNCPNCLATDWAEYLLLRCIHCSAVFESEQIRYEIGTYAYGDGSRKGKGALCPPYELFPLCPYCNTAHWCPAEDTRVHELRQRVARNDLWMRALWIGVAVVALVVISMMALGMLHG